MLIDPTCPVEARSYEIQFDKSKDLIYCKVVFCNLSDKVVTNLEYCIICFDSFGEPIGNPPNNKVMEHIVDINVEPRYFFSGKAPTPLPNHSKTRSVQIIITKVKYQDGSIWVYESSNLIDIKTVKLEKNELSNLKEVAGEDAICYAREDKNYWQCVCGKVSLFDDEKCLRCKRVKEDVITFNNPNKINIILQKIKEQEEQEERRERKEKERKEDMQIRKDRVNETYDKNAKTSIKIGIVFLSIITFFFIDSNLNFALTKRIEYMETIRSIINYSNRILVILGLIFAVKGRKSLKYNAFALAGIIIYSAFLLVFIVFLVESLS